MLNQMMIQDRVLEAVRVAAFTFIAAVFADTRTYIALIMIISAINFLCGLRAGQRQGEKYSHKKAFNAFIEYATAMAIVFFTAATCRLLEPTASCDWILKAIAGLFALIYAKNIFRNLKILQPENEFICILDVIINTKYLTIKKQIKDGTLFNLRAKPFKDGSRHGDTKQPDSGSEEEPSSADR